MSDNFHLYQKALELAGIGVWEYNLITGELFWNARLRTIYDADESYSPNVIDMMGFLPSEPDYGHNRSKFEKIIAAGNFSNCQVQVRTLKGNLKYIASNARTEVIKGQCIRILGSVQEITNLRSFVETPELCKSKFYQAFDHSPIGMALVSPEGSWMKVNDSLCKMLGYQNNELLNLTFQDITHADDLPQDRAHLQQMLNKELTAYSVEKRYKHKDGGIIWVSLTSSLVWDKDHTPLCFVTQVMDITERIRKTEQLITRGRGISNIIKSRKIGTWEWHMSADVFICDERCATIIGCIDCDPPDTMAKWLRGVHPEDLEMLVTKMQDCFRSESNYRCEYRMKHPDGNWIWIESYGELIEWSSEGRPLVMLGTETDITDKKQIELDQEYAMKLLTGQNERLIDFAYIVSHNLRSHAGNFQMMLDLYACEQDEKERHQIVDFLKQNANNLSETIVNLNEVVNIQLDGQRRLMPLNLRDQVDRAITNLSGMVGKERAVFTIRIDPLIIVEYNQAYLENILLNFFSNAIKYKHPSRNPEISVEASLYKGGVQLKITDNGLGIDLELYGKKLFGMYKTFHAHEESRGLGLFITKNQVEAMGGKIEVESTSGIGTTFKIHIKSKKK